ncbi:MAG: thiamine phosphate synthase [Bryobacteraceae bacterium]
MRDETWIDALRRTTELSDRFLGKSTMTLPRLYPILDVGLLEARRCPVIDAARALLNAGVEILQWRCKQTVSRRRFEEVEQVAALCRRFNVPLIVNDRADLALLLEAGLHLGQDDLPPSLARRVLPDGMIGLSTHNKRQIADSFAEPVDYLALGPIFLT